MKWCIRQLWCPSTILYNITSIAYNGYTDIYLLLNTFIYLQDLAVRMQQEPNFLMTCGVSERDADEIALQVSDLGLGYHPVTDFSNAQTIESAV